VPEYLAPAVYVEETSFRAKSIEGVSTSTTGFVGPTLTGPSGGTPELLTSFADFERIYGGLDDLDYGATNPATNFLAHAVRAYFNEGGSRLYVSRAVPDGAKSADASITTGVNFIARFSGKGGNGTITVDPALSPATPRSMKSAPIGTVLVGDASPAMLPGSQAVPFDLSGANSTLKFALGSPPKNINIKLDVGKAEVSVVSPLAAPGAPTKLDIVLNGVKQPGIDLKPSMTVGEIVDVINSHLQGGYARLDAGALIIGAHVPDTDARVSVVVKANAQLTIPDTVGAANVTDLTEVTVAELDWALRGADIRAVANGGMVTFQTAATGTTAKLEWKGAQDPMGLGATAAEGEGTARTFVKKETGWFDASDNAATGLPTQEDDPAGNFVTLTIITRDASGREALYEGVGLDPKHPRWIGSVLSEVPSRQSEYLQRLYAIQFENDPPADGLTLYGAILQSGQRRTFTLEGGSDGAPPTTAKYEAALEALSGIEDVSIIAAPGSSAYESSIAKGTRNALISAAEKRRAYRIAVLDTPPEQGGTQARAWKGEFDSKYAALYYPWVVVPNPLARAGDARIPKEISLPPSGFVCGIYARSDVERGVFKAPANEVVRSALRFETDVNFAQQEVLNPLGVNCLRFFPGRGYRVWGARTASSDPEWKYVNVRRYFNFLERSIDVGTQWAVFEPNGERLWANIRETISSFLETQWREGALLGSDTKQAFFVRCDRSTMTQDDLDNGRLICLVGVAVVKPAEFVIFRIGQKTADARN
jgi:phage tail sheath protein FI